MRRRQFLGALLAAGASRLLPRPTPPTPDRRYVVGVDYGAGSPTTVVATVARTGGVLVLYPASMRYLEMV